MAIRNLRTRFIFCGCLLMLTTVACGVWSADRLLHMSKSIGFTLQDSEQTVDAISSLSHALEREDDAVLLAIDGRLDEAKSSLRTERAAENAAMERLQMLLTEADESAILRSLRSNIDDYRRAGDDLVASAAVGSATLEQYRHSVNPDLRRAVDDCGRLRDIHFGSLAQAGADLRDSARHATWVVAGVSLVALLLSAAISVYLTRRVVGPIKMLTQFTDSIRFGNFSGRVEPSSSDELGQLAIGLNRMAEALSELQRFNLAQLLESKWTLEATLEALPDAVILVDSSERVLCMNRTARELMGETGNTAGASLSALALPASSVKAVRDALAGKTTPAARADLKEVITWTLDGHPVKLLPLVMPVRQLQNETFGAVLALYDVTDFAKLDELRMELIAVASHELKNPLTTLRMNILLLCETANHMPPRQQEMLANAMLGCEELGKTIDELLDLTRADAGTLRLGLDRVDLCALAEEAARAFRSRFDEAGIEFRVEKQVPQAICSGDAARLNMVLSNLLSNALKYVSGGGRVSVRVSSMQNAGVKYGPSLQIAVTDTGPGIPTEFRERVFEKFFRVEHHRKAEGRELRGTGIGLYLCKHIIEAHGGNIWCDGGDNGVGTKIALTLPGDNEPDRSN